MQPTTNHLHNLCPGLVDSLKIDAFQEKKTELLSDEVLEEPMKRELD
jgi:hypothetical protein